MAVKELNLENMTPQEKEIYELAKAQFQKESKGQGGKGGGEDVEARLAKLEQENQKLKSSLGEWAEFGEWYNKDIKPHISGDNWNKFQQFIKGGGNAGGEGGEGGEGGAGGAGGEGAGRRKAGEYMTDEDIQEQISALKKEFKETLTTKELQFLNLRNYDQQMFNLIRNHPELTDEDIENISKHMTKNAVGKVSQAYKDLFGEKETEKKINDRIAEEKKKWEEEQNTKHLNDMNMGFTVPKKAFSTQDGEKTNKKNEVRKEVMEKISEKYGPGVLR